MSERKIRTGRLTHMQTRTDGDTERETDKHADTYREKETRTGRLTNMHTTYRKRQGQGD